MEEMRTLVQSKDDQLARMEDRLDAKDEQLRELITQLTTKNDNGGGRYNNDDNGGGDNEQRRHGEGRRKRETDSNNRNQRNGRGGCDSKDDSWFPVDFHYKDESFNQNWSKRK